MSSLNNNNNRVIVCNFFSLYFGGQNIERKISATLTPSLTKYLPSNRRNKEKKQHKNDRQKTYAQWPS